MPRFEARRASSTGEIAVIDTEENKVEREYGVTAYAMRQAIEDAKTWNELDERHKQSDRADVQALFRKSVNI